MPRAGSTLFQNVMAQNPAFYVTPTSGLVNMVYAARKAFAQAAPFKAQDRAVYGKALHRFCSEGMKGYFSALTEKPFVIDKSRGWMEHLDFLEWSFGQEVKCVCLVRDLRQVVASLNALHPMRNPLDHFEQGPLGPALNRLEKASRQKMLILRYEDFTRRPKNVMGVVYDYFGMEPYAYHDFDKVEKVTSEDDSVYGFDNLHDVKPKIEPVLHDTMFIDCIPPRYKWYAEAFGYAP